MTCTLLAAALIMAIHGMLSDRDNVTCAGILIAVAALPPITVWQSQRAHHIKADQLEEAHTAGYRLALDHVARGLLDPPPSGGESTPHNRAERDRAAGHPTDDACPIDPVRRLRAVPYNPPEKAVM